MERMPALDGIRGIAILLVIGCHAALPGMALSGTVGVTVFFVLSGFLITGLLLRGEAAEGVDFKRFWTRRARRLLPALITMILVLFPVFVLAGWSPGSYWAEAKPGLLYYANFHELANGWTQPFGHLWSLSVEEQFYFAFPIIVALLRCRPKALLAFAVAAGLVSVGLRVACSLDPHLAMRGLLGVDTNAFALLLGAGIAAAHALDWRPPRPGLTVTAGVALIVATPLWPTAEPLWQAVALPAAAGAALLILSALARPANRALAWGPLRRIGQVSYGWYLWQGPLLALTWPTTEPGNAAGKVSVCLLALVVAMLSWRFVERPFLRRPQVRPAAPVALLVELRP